MFYKPYGYMNHYYLYEPLLIWLVVWTILEKYEFDNRKDDIPCMKWKIKLMFQKKKHQPVVNSS